MTSMLEDAINYRRAGFSVIPIKPRDKRPLIQWEQYQSEAPTEQQIQEWFAKWPDANMALVTGAISDCVVIDIDTEQAKAKLKNFVDDFDLAGVPRSKTGKGWQLFFKHPAVPIPNRAGLIPGLDTRGDGGYVVAPPSIHPNGKQYRWEVPLNGKLPELPKPLLKLIQAAPSAEQGPRERFDTASALAGVPEGKRDQTIFQLACKLRSADVPQNITEGLVTEAARNCQPPFDEQKALAKVRGAYSRYEAKAQMKQAEIWPEFQSAEQIIDEPEDPLMWRWHECLPTAGSSVLVAQPKIGKTTFAANLALATARGLPFLGRKTQQCPVAYAYLDGPPREIKDAFKTLGLKRTDPVFVCTGPAPRDYVAWIMAQVENHGIRFVVVDTFQKFFKIVDLNAYSEVVNKSAPMLDAAAARDVHLLFLHHAGKGDRGDLDSAIGSTGIRGQAQSYLHLKLLPESKRRIFRTDQRHGQGNFAEVSIGFDRSGWLEIKGSREDAEIADAKPKLREVFEGDQSELTERQIRAAIPLKAIVVSKALREMFKAGEVERAGEGKKNRPFRYSLANSLMAENEGPKGHSDGLPKGGLLRGKNDSCPNSNYIGTAILGHESKNEAQATKKIKKNSSPEGVGHEWDTKGHEAKNDVAGTRIPGTQKDPWD